MQIITLMDIYEKKLEASCVTIGNFDGVHRGHVEVFNHLKLKSLARGLPSVVVTFEPHPLKILAPESAPSLITTLSQKSALIEDAGIDYLVVVPFSKEFSLMSASDFVLKVLYNSLGMQHIIIGHDYAFGRGREGDFHTLTTLGALHEFTIEDLPPFGDGEVIYSSSLVRSAVTEGKMDTASRILGRYYQITGTVVHGREIGTEIGFPTANIVTENELIPADGVYAVLTLVNGQRFKGACNIGPNPTFGGSTQAIEVFMLDFSGDIYGHEVSIQFIQKLRQVQKFADVAALKCAISEDVINTRAILKNVNSNYL